MNDAITYESAISHPLVTVITATYNLVSSGRADNIRQCLESVHAQSYRPIEHLIIDGASTDGTLELLREYEEKGWVKIYSEPDKGIYDALNKGIERATGKYCSFLNSDDFWHDPHGVEVAIHLLEVGRGDFSYAAATYIKPDGKGVYAREPDIGAFFCMVPCNHQTMFYRTDMLREFKYDAEGYRMVADCDLTTRMLLAGKKGVYVPLNYTTFREGGLSNDASLHEAEYIRLLRRYFGPIVGTEAATAMYKWDVPAKLLTSIASLVHPDIVELMKRTFMMHEGGGSELVLRKREEEIPYHLIYNEHAVGMQVFKRERWLGLFGIPLLEKRCSRGMCRTRLFCFLPLWKTKLSADGEVRHYLFDFIPMWSYKATCMPTLPAGSTKK